MHSAAALLPKLASRQQQPVRSTHDRLRTGTAQKVRLRRGGQLSSAQLSRRRDAMPAIQGITALH